MDVKLIMEDVIKCVWILMVVMCVYVGKDIFLFRIRLIVKVKWLMNNWLIIRKYIVMILFKGFKLYFLYFVKFIYWKKKKNVG